MMVKDIARYHYGGSVAGKSAVSSLSGHGFET